MERIQAESRRQTASPAVRTFLIADVRGYTAFTLQHGDEAAARLAAQFAAIARDVVEAHQGEVIELRGDEALAVFVSARHALRAAIALQERFGSETIEHTEIPFRVGVGLDAGEAIPVEGGFRGAALNLAARLCSLAGRGEVLASEGVIHLARKLDGVTYAERGSVPLKGFADPVRVIQVTAEGGAPAGQEPSGEEVAKERPLPIGGFLGALPGGQLVARESELNRLASVIDAVAGGSGRLVLLAGEPGVGKTRLAQEVTLQLRDRGFAVATGRCYQPQEAVPFYPFLEALGTLYAAAPPSLRSTVPVRWPYLAYLLPSVSLPMPSSAPEGSEAQERLFWTVTGFIQAITEETPVALLLDDLHWADSTSLALLQHLARHTRADRVLILGTYRDVEVGRQHPLERAVRDLSREHLAERVSIRRLPQSGTAQLIAVALGEDELSPEFSALVYRHTDGNPFFTEEVLHALVERGDVFRRDGVWDRRGIEEIEVPESVRSAVGERLSHLRDESQHLLREASVLGQRFAFGDLLGMDGRSEDEIEAVLEEAEAAGLVREIASEEYAFNHALTQQVLYDELSGRRRRRLHLAAGAALERLPETRREERAGELAWHFVQADDWKRALKYSLLAGDGAERVFAHGAAEEHYRRAVELAAEGESSHQEAIALEKLGTVLATLARYGEALEMSGRAASLYRAMSDEDSEIRVMIQLGFAHRAAGTADAGIAQLEPLLQRVEGENRPRDVVELSLMLEHLYLATGRFRDGLVASRRAVDIARHEADGTTVARAEVALATELLMGGRPVEGTSILEGAIAALEPPQTTAAWRSYGRGVSNLASAYLSLGRFQEARITALKLLALQERVQYPWDMAAALLQAADACRLLGSWDEARGYVDRQLEIVRRVGSSWWAAYPYLVLGGISAYQGEWEEAQEALREALHIASVNSDLQAIREANCRLVELDMLRGHPAEGIARLKPLLDAPAADDSWVAEALPVLAGAYLMDGESERALEMTEEAIRRATSASMPVALAESLVVRGSALAAHRRWQEAKGSLEEGAERARAMPYPYLEGRALYAEGVMYGEQGDPAQARERFTRAADIFQRLGARPYLERCREAAAGLTV